MEDYPRNLAEFETRFATDAACRELSGQAAVAGRLSLSSVRRAENLAGGRDFAAMFELRLPKVR